MHPAVRALLTLAPVAILAAGCAARAEVRAPSTPGVAAQEIAPPAVAPALPEAAPELSQEPADGVIHVVQPGQTLWRIARAYDVPIETIASANDLADPAKLEVGTPLFIPGARATIDVAPYPAPLARPSERVPPPGIGAAALAWPVEDGEVMRPFGEPRRNHRHAGLDIRGQKGQPILAAQDGVVAFAGATRGGYGQMVVLDHGDGVQTLYAHAEKTLVKTGDKVARGEAIALVGRTGNATTEHCHFEVRRDNHPIDPLPMFATTAQARR